MSEGVAVIVGHGPGIGDAVARAFAAAGHPVALIARDGARTQAAAEALGGMAKGFGADAGDEGSLAAALDRIGAHFGTPAALVYNAAIWRPGPVLGVTAAEAEADYRVCVVGAWVAAGWAAPLMRGRGGSILFTGGGLADRPSAGAPTLSIGKGAIRALALMLADELAPDGIRVGTVTVAGQVGPATLPAERVAEAFLALHRGAPDRRTAEYIVTP